MNTKKISYHAQKIIEDYLELPFPNKQVSCPYFNNRRTKVRGALRALVGKGNPEDIVEESIIIALREKINFSELNNEEIKHFLVDKNLGIDCSGFVYYVLEAELKAQHKSNLNKYLHRPWIKNPLRKLIINYLLGNQFAFQFNITQLIIWKHIFFHPDI